MATKFKEMRILRREAHHKKEKKSTGIIPRGALGSKVTAQEELGPRPSLKEL